MKKIIKITIPILLLIILISIAVYIYFLMFVDVSGCLPFSRNQLSLLTQKAENRDAKACWCLYAFYEEDDTLNQYWLRKSAEYGYPRAQVLLYSYLIHKSFGQEIEAVAWLKKAADKNNVFAQSDLGELYREGKIVKQDLQQSEFWYRKAANSGLISAMLYLARFLPEQYNSKLMIIEAYSWAVIAQLKSPSQSSYADEARKRQEMIIKKAKTLGFDKDTITRESKPIIEEMAKKITVYKFETSDDLYIDCLKIIGRDRK